MNKVMNRHRIWLKAIATVVVCLFVFNDFAYSLSAYSRFKPFEVNTEVGLKEDAAFLYLGNLIGQALSIEKRRNEEVTPGAIKLLARKHVGKIDFARFKWQEIYREGKAFCLPYVRKDDGRIQILKYLHPDDVNEGFPHRILFQFDDGTKVVLEDPLKDEEEKQGHHDHIELSRRKVGSIMRNGLQTPKDLVEGGTSVHMSVDESSPDKITSISCNLLVADSGADNASAAERAIYSETKGSLQVVMERKDDGEFSFIGAPLYNFKKILEERALHCVIFLIDPEKVSPDEKGKMEGFFVKGKAIEMPFRKTIPPEAIKAVLVPQPIAAIVKDLLPSHVEIVGIPGQISREFRITRPHTVDPASEKYKRIHIAKESKDRYLELSVPDFAGRLNDYLNSLAPGTRLIMHGTRLTAPSDMTAPLVSEIPPGTPKDIFQILKEKLGNPASIEAVDLSVGDDLFPVALERNVLGLISEDVEVLEGGGSGKNSADIVTINNVFNVTEGLRQEISKANSMLRPGGMLIMTFPLVSDDEKHAADRDEASGNVLKELKLHRFSCEEFDYIPHGYPFLHDFPEKSKFIIAQKTEAPALSSNAEDMAGKIGDFKANTVSLETATHSNGIHERPSKALVGICQKLYEILPEVNITFIGAEGMAQVENPQSPHSFDSLRAKGVKEKGRFVYRGNIEISVKGPYPEGDLSKVASILAMLIGDERFIDGFEPDQNTESLSGEIYTEIALKAEIDIKLNELEATVKLRSATVDAATPLEKKLRINNRCLLHYWDKLFRYSELPKRRTLKQVLTEVNGVAKELKPLSRKAAEEHLSLIEEIRENTWGFLFALNYQIGKSTGSNTAFSLARKLEDILGICGEILEGEEEEEAPDEPPAEAPDIQEKEEPAGDQGYYDKLRVARGGLVELFTNIEFLFRGRKDVDVGLVRDVLSIGNNELLEGLVLLLKDLKGKKAEISDGTLSIIKGTKRAASACLIPFVRLVNTISSYERENSTFFIRSWLDRANNMRQKLEEIVEACKDFASRKKKSPSDGSPHRIFEILRTTFSGRYATLETIRENTKNGKGKHLSLSVLKRDLGTLVSLGIAEKKIIEGRAFFRAVNMSGKRWRFVEPVLKSLGPKPTKKEKDLARKKVVKNRKETSQTAPPEPQDSVERDIRFYSQKYGSDNPFMILSVALKKLNWSVVQYFVHYLKGVLKKGYKPTTLEEHVFISAEHKLEEYRRKMQALNEFGESKKKPPPGSIYGVFEHLCSNEINSPKKALSGQDIVGGLEGISSFESIKDDLRNLCLHLKLVERDETQGTGKDARYYVPERTRKRAGLILPVLERFRGKDLLRPDKALLEEVFKNKIKPILVKAIFGENVITDELDLDYEFQQFVERLRREMLLEGNEGGEKVLQWVPQHIMLSSLLRCTNQCAHCLESAGPHRKEEMSAEHIARALDTSEIMLNNPVASIVGGEVLLRSDLMEIIGKFPVYSLTTNAAMMTTKEVAERFIKDLKANFKARTAAAKSGFTISEEQLHATGGDPYLAAWAQYVVDSSAGLSKARRKEFRVCISLDDFHMAQHPVSAAKIANLIEAVVAHYPEMTLSLISVWHHWGEAFGELREELERRGFNFEYDPAGRDFVLTKGDWRKRIAFGEDVISRMGRAIYLPDESDERLNFSEFDIWEFANKERLIAGVDGIERITLNHAGELTLCDSWIAEHGPLFFGNVVEEGWGTVLKRVDKDPLFRAFLGSPTDALNIKRMIEIAEECDPGIVERIQKGKPGDISGYLYWLFSNPERKLYVTYRLLNEYHEEGTLRGESPYAGMSNDEIKALVKEQVAELRADFVRSKKIDFIDRYYRTRKGLTKSKRTEGGAFLPSQTNDVVVVAERFLREKPEARVLDLGAGNAKALSILSLYARVAGDEIDPELFAEGETCIDEFSGHGIVDKNRIDLAQRDFLKTEKGYFSRYDLIYTYWPFSPRGSKKGERLKKRLLEEMHPDAILVVKRVSPELHEDLSVEFEEVEFPGEEEESHPHLRAYRLRREKFITGYEGTGLAREDWDEKVVDDFCDAVMARLVETAGKKDGKNIIIGIDTSWLPFDQKNGKLEQLLGRAKEKFKILRQLGGTKVIIIAEEGERLAREVAKAASDEEAGVDYENIAILGSKDTLSSDRFKDFMECSLLVEVEAGYFSLEMITLAFKLLTGFTDPEACEIDYEQKTPRYYRFRARPVDPDELLDKYDLQTRLLEKHA